MVVWEKLGKGMALMASMVLLYAVRGWAVALAWGWFMVPLGVPLVTVLGAVGLLLLMGIMQGNTSTQGKSKAAAEVAAVVTELLAYTLMMLGLAYVAHLLMGEVAW